MCRAGDGPAETPDPATGTPQSLVPSPGALRSHREGFVQHDTAGGDALALEAREHFRAGGPTAQEFEVLMPSPNWPLPEEPVRTRHGHREGG